MTDSTPKLTDNGKKVGRPKKDKKNPVGRPKGEATVMKEYRQRMLNSPRSKKVLDTIFKAALDDDHKHQAAAWKLIVDRIVPVSGFEKEAGVGARSAVEIVIKGVEGVQIGPSGASKDASDAIDAEYSEVPNDGD